LGSTDPSQTDPGRLVIFSALLDHGVEFVVIGGVAAILHGAPIVSLDLDIVPDPGESNLTRLTQALLALHAEVLFAGPVRRFPDGEWMRASRFWNFTTDAGRFDVRFAPAGVEEYAVLRNAAQAIETGDRTVLVASLDHLIAMKEAANRPKDQQALPILQWLRDRTPEP
jgi:hypothetical protein